MILLILFAFVAGVVTVLSPCILPLLPIILSSSTAGDRKHSIAIILGFVGSFTLFTLFLSLLVRTFHLPADLFRNLAIIFLLLAGLSQLIPSLQLEIEKLFIGFSGFKTSSGFVTGVSLGLVWTPCVGPILASVIALALSGSVTSSTFFITLAYSIGSAIPMLIILQTGKRLFLNSQIIQKVFAGLMIASALAIFFNLDRKFPIPGLDLTKLEKYAIKISPAPMLTAPEIIPGGQWFNSRPLSIKELRGKVVLVDFWTYTCINCIRTLPYLQAWHQKYADQGLVIIGVHTPEFEFEKNPSNVKKAISDFGLTYPIVQDNDYATWNAYANHYWPAKYFIDKNGQIAGSHFGEGDYDQSELLIQKLLSLSQPVANPTYTITARTPELYVGSDRFQPGYINFSGDWTDAGQYRLPSTGAILNLGFNASQVFLVMRPSGTSGRLKVYLDDKFQKTITVDADKLYTLVKLPAPGSHRLKLEFLDSNLQLYAFTFG